MPVPAMNFAAALAGLIAAWRWYQTTMISTTHRTAIRRIGSRRHSPARHVHWGDRAAQ